MKISVQEKRIISKTRKDLLIAANTLSLLIGAGITGQNAKADTGLSLSNAALTHIQSSPNQAATAGQVDSASVAQSGLLNSNLVQTPITNSVAASNHAVTALASSLAGSLISSLAISNSSSVNIQASSASGASLLGTKVGTALASSVLASGTSTGNNTVNNTNNDMLMKQFAGGAFQGLTAHSLYMIAHWANQPERFTPEGHLYKGQILTDNFGTVNQSFEVLDYVDSSNPASGLPDNGFEGLALAPIVNGQADLSRIIISWGALQAENTPPYATDFKKDALTAFETVVGGMNIYTDGSYTTEGQTVTAEKYAEKIKAEYPNADLMVTGLSLGGYLSLSTGARIGIPAFAFVGDDPTNSLTPEQNAFIHSHPTMFVNIRNAYDLLWGAHGANGTNSAVYYDGGFKGIVLSHYQFPNSEEDPIQFNPDGSISNAAPVIGPAINDIMNLTDPLMTAASDILTHVMLDTVGTPLAPLSVFLSGVITSAVKDFNTALINIDPILANIATFIAPIIKAGESTVNDTGKFVESSITDAISRLIDLANLIGGVRPGVGTVANPTTSIESTPVKPLPLSLAASENSSTAVTVGALSTISSSAAATTPNQQLEGGAFAGITAHQFYALAKDLYDPLRFIGQVSLPVGDIVYENQDQTGQAFQVIYTVNSANPQYGYADNGFQASALAPIVDGKPDLSRIVVALSGSNNRPEMGLNSDYAKDAITDFETVVAGKTYYSDGTKVIQGQSQSAEYFVNSIKATFPKAQVIVTGISLGGYLALSSGVQTESPAFAFEGDDPSNILTPEQLAYVHAHPTMYVNNRNAYDLFMGSFNGNGTNTARYWDGGFEGLTGSHYQSIGDVTEDPYKFNPDGSIADPAAPTMGPLFNSIATVADGLLAGIGSIITTTVAKASSSQLLSPIVSGAVGAMEGLVAAAHPLIVAANGAESAVGKVIGTAISAAKAVKDVVVNVSGAVIHTVIDVAVSGLSHVFSLFGPKA